MALVFRLCGGRGSLVGRPATMQGMLHTYWSRSVATSPVMGALKPQAAEDYWAKNKRLRRPVSPHLTIYKPQITSLLSLTHRATGVALTAVLSGFSIGMLVLPGSYPYYLGVIQSLHFGPAIIFGAKFLLALPFMYHLCNGIRHLVWDLGYGFTLHTLYKTGYIVLFLSILMSGAVAAL